MLTILGWVLGKNVSDSHDTPILKNIESAPYLIYPHYYYEFIRG